MRALSAFEYWICVSQMNTRNNRRRLIVAMAGALALGTGLAACKPQPKTGPLAIDWGHDTDARCHMVISDRHFAAEIREPAGMLRKFDDIGCAMFWLAGQPFDEQTPGLEIWVADYRDGSWLAAQTAHYLAGRPSPMRYQFAASGDAEAGTVSYAEMKKSVLARGR